MRILAELAANQLRAREHIGPLVVAAELHVAVIALKELVEVIALHEHIVKLEERESLLHAVLIALRAEHIVDREMGTYVADKLDVIQVPKPVGIVHHSRLALAELDEAGHLPLKALAVAVNLLDGHHAAHIGSAGGISYHTRAAADQSNRLIARHLEALHQAERHKVPYMQTVRGRIEADIEGRLALVYEAAHLFLVGHLCNQPAGFELIVAIHLFFSSFKIIDGFSIPRRLHSLKAHHAVLDYHRREVAVLLAAARVQRDRPPAR